MAAYYGEEGFAKRYRLNRLVRRAISQCERRNRMRKKTKGLAPSQENCPNRENESTLARSQ